MLENTTLIVTTRGRVGMQYTLENLCSEVLNFVTIVCYPGEAKQHAELWGDKVQSIVEHEDWCENIDQIRFWCMMNFETDYIIFMDDNLCFHVRRPSDKGNDAKTPLHKMCEKHYTPETISQIQLDMFAWIDEQLKTDLYGIVGIGCRSGNQNHEEDFDINTRIYAFWSINKKMFNQYISEYNIDPYTFKGDFYTMLFMLTHGYPNICSYKYAFDKVGGANNKGGCSIYRTNEVIIKEAKQLQSDFPDFVKLRSKKSKSWNSLGDEILDVQVAWKKAFEYGYKKYQLK